MELVSDRLLRVAFVLLTWPPPGLASSRKNGPVK